MRVLPAYLALFSALAGLLVLAARLSPDVRPITLEGPPGITLVDIDERRVTPLSPGSFGGEASVSADGRWAVYHGGGAEADLSVYLVDLESDEPQPQEVARGRFPAISPDGRAIAYVGDRAGATVLIIRLEDGAEVSLGPAGIPAAWSPDGRWLAYRGEYRDADQPIGIYLADTTTWQTRLVAQARVCFCDALYTLAWSANSRYFHYPFPLDGVGLVAVDGSALPPVENAFEWSADGSRLFWNAMRGEGPGQTYSFHVYDFATGQSRLLASTRQNVHWSVSPRGDRFAIGAFDESQTRLIDVATGTDVSDAVIGSMQAWSPDGAYFSTFLPKGGDCVFAIYEAASGDLVRCLASVSQVEWTQAPGTYLYTEAREPQRDPFLSGDIWLVNVNSQRERQIAKNIPIGCLDYLTWIPGRNAFLLPGRCGI